MDTAHSTNFSNLLSLDDLPSLADDDAPTPKPTKSINTLIREFPNKLYLGYQLINRYISDSGICALIYGGIADDDDDDDADLSDIQVKYNNIAKLITSSKAYQSAIRYINQLLGFTGEDNVIDNFIYNFFVKYFFSFDFYSDNHIGFISNYHSSTFKDIANVQANKSGKSYRVTFTVMPFGLTARVDVYKRLRHYYTVKAKEYQNKLKAEKDKCADYDSEYTNKDSWMDIDLTFDRLLNCSYTSTNLYFNSKHILTEEQTERMIEYDIKPTGKVIELRKCMCRLIVLDFDIHQVVDKLPANILEEYEGSDRVISLVKTQIIKYLHKLTHNAKLPIDITPHNGLHVYFLNEDPEGEYTNDDLNNINRFVNIYKPSKDMSSIESLDIEEDWKYLFQLDVFTSNQPVWSDEEYASKVQQIQNEMDKLMFSRDKKTAGIVAPTTHVKTEDDQIKEYTLKDFTFNDIIQYTIQDFILAKDNIFAKVLTPDYLSKVKHNGMDSVDKLSDSEFLKYVDERASLFNEFFLKYASEQLPLLIDCFNSLPSANNKYYTIHNMPSGRSVKYVLDDSSKDYSASMFQLNLVINSLDDSMEDVKIALILLFNLSDNKYYSEYADVESEYISEQSKYTLTTHAKASTKPSGYSSLETLYKYAEAWNNEYYKEHLKPFITKFSKDCAKGLYTKCVTASLQNSVSNESYDTIDTIKYHSRSEIKACDKLEDKFKLLCESIRYDPIRGLFYVYIPAAYELVEMKAEHFKLKYLPTIISSKYVKQIYDNLELTVSLDGIPKLGVTDIHRCHPLSIVTDESPATKERDIALFNEFFNDMFKNSDKKVKTYILKWIAAMVQDPGCFEAAIIILSGQHGTGKTFLCKLIAFLLYTKHTVNFKKTADQFIDSNYTSYSDKLSDHTGKFNAKTGYRIFSGIQELDDCGETNGRNMLTADLKRLTDPMKGLEKKGIDSTNVQNICQILIATNSDKPLPIEYTERRYLAVETNCEHANDKDYWDKFYKGFSQPYFVKHIFDYFADTSIFDLSDINTLKIPRTKLLVNMMLQSLPVVHKFFCAKYKNCCKGLSYKEFLELIKAEPILQGSYKTPANLWADYIGKYHCVLSKATHKYIPNEDAVANICDIAMIYSKMYDSGELQDGSISPDDEDDVDDGLKLEKTVRDMRHLYESHKSKYYYILTTEIGSNDELKDYLIDNDWTYSKHINHNGKRTGRGYIKSVDDE